MIKLEAPITPLSKDLDHLQHIPLDIDVTPQDNSKTKKESSQWTYKQFHGSAPIMSYVGTEVWCIGAELRPGSQHSQNDFVPFLKSVLNRLRRVTQAPVLLRLDSRHDAEDTRREVAAHHNVGHIIKLNPRTQYSVATWLPTFEAKGVQWIELRPGKTYATHSIIHETDYG